MKIVASLLRATAIAPQSYPVEIVTLGGSLSSELAIQEIDEICNLSWSFWRLSELGIQESNKCMCMCMNNDVDLFIIE